jgi:hypothetical protein
MPYDLVALAPAAACLLLISRNPASALVAMMGLAALFPNLIILIVCVWLILLLARYGPVCVRTSPLETAPPVSLKL